MARLRVCYRPTLLHHPSRRGFHSSSSIPHGHGRQDLVRKIRFLASVRNKLIHDPTYNKIDDRKRFIAAYQSAKRELQAILRSRHSGRATECAIM